MFKFNAAKASIRRRIGLATLVAVVAGTSLGLEPAAAFPVSVPERSPVVKVDSDGNYWFRRRNSGDRDWRERRADRYEYRRWRDRDDWDDRYRYRRWRDRDRDNDVAAGIAGLATGAIIGGLLSQGGGGGYGYGAPVASAPPAGGYAPFSAGYVSYCSSKYRSFDARTGTFLGYDGRRHFCR